ncbi:MAG: dehydrogenase [Verrucomicrobia bacterium]|nr:MAG: dehydrogenase [Verrucomicrobiota bacterium]
MDNCGVCANLIDEVAARLKSKTGIPRERIAVCSSHTHSGPCTLGFAPNIFASTIPAGQQTTIERYSKELTDKLEQVALAALADRRLARLAWNEGSATFARNRRTEGGPVDPALPILCATGLDGQVRAVVLRRLGRLCAGSCSTRFSRRHRLYHHRLRGGCEPVSAWFTRVGETARRGSGRRSQTNARWTPDTDPATAHLPNEALRAALRQTADARSMGGTRAAERHRRLSREAKSGTARSRQNAARCPALRFGDQLAMVFLAGEVVVDYSTRLKNEFDADRLWVTAYANDVPCYIPSRRILQEGGYEAETSLWYYDRPARLAPQVEDLIADAVHEVTPKDFAVDAKKAGLPPPKSPEAALAAFHTRTGFTVELAAAEPLVVDPVAIDWGADGKLWVVEMRDYPMGMDGHWKPGGRIKFLEDLDGDGQYDQATVFLDGLPFPTGVMAWNKGVLVCAAPDILYAEDTDGDGKADVVKKIFTGFATENYQARVNSLSLGLDNWIYGANGLIGGTIHRVGVTEYWSHGKWTTKTSTPELQHSNSPPIDISGRDFRMHPDTGEFEPASGLTQQGRVRDDRGNWYGCDNSTLLWHYPLPDPYGRRNPHVLSPEPRVFVPADSDPNHLFPVSRMLERFNDPGSAGRTTSACGLGIYRDDLPGTNYYGNAFICEPVHNLVHRLILKPNGVTFRGYRAPDELQSEFLSSKDNWFRPVQARTGPDGALWIVDMYRFVVEHPRWIPPDRLARLDVRAGDDKGRIYRVYPRHKSLRPIRNLSRLSAIELAAALETPNGTERDRIHLELLRRNDKTGLGSLTALSRTSGHPAVRLQALCVLDGLNALTPALLENALNDPDPAVRQHAIRLSEPFLSGDAGVPAGPVSANKRPGLEGVAPHDSHLGAALLQLLHDPDATVRYQLALSLGQWNDPRSAEGAALLQLLHDPDATVRYQLALSLGQWNDPRSAEALAQLLQSGLEDPWLRTAVVSSAPRFPAIILRSLLTDSTDSPARKWMIDQLIATAVGTDNRRALEQMLSALSPAQGKPAELWQFEALGSLLDALNRHGRNLRSLSSASSVEVGAAVARAEQVVADARRAVREASVDEATRVAAVGLLGHDAGQLDADLELLEQLLAPQAPPRLQTEALAALARTRSPKVPGLLLADWPHHSPSLRNAVLGTLSARDEWINRLLDAIEKGTIAASEISPANRQRLLKRGSEAIRRRADTLLSGNPSGNRGEVLARYESALNLAADPARGEAVFAKVCSTCHAFGGQGHAVGPDLAAFRSKSPKDFLVAILDPNAAIEPRFINYQIETKDGRSLSGVVNAEAASSLTLVQGGGLEEKILRTDITEIKASNLSLMPEGLEQNMTPQDLADLIAYLKQSR